MPGPLTHANAQGVEGGAGVSVRETGGGRSRETVERRANQRGPDLPRDSVTRPAGDARELLSNGSEGPGLENGTSRFLKIVGEFKSLRHTLQAKQNLPEARSWLRACLLVTWAAESSSSPHIS